MAGYNLCWLDVVWEDGCLQVLLSSGRGLFFTFLDMGGLVSCAFQLGSVGGTPTSDLVGLGVIKSASLTGAPPLILMAATFLLFYSLSYLLAPPIKL